MSPSVTYPVHVNARVDPDLSRWSWLVKWFLAIPHLLVLAVLWVAFVVTTFVAGVAVAITGRYPRSIFDFNVGVLRWTWRVQLYAFTLTTDRYPPFSLAADPTFPGELEVEYPERLSRGLVWVKWWLLAIPHYLVIAFFSGGGPHLAGGLITVLAVIAGVHVALGRGYPTSIFDLVMGMHRWSWRVVAYAALMRDEYPPFQLDVGGFERGPASFGSDPLPA